MLHLLPDEIIHLISKQVGQQDAIKLALTCKKLYLLTLPRIYEHIVVDSTPKNFSNIIIPHNINGHSTIIRSVYSLKKFLNILVTNSYFCSLIRIVESGKSTPDISDYDLNFFLKAIIPNLINLKQLNWLSENSKIDSKLLQQVSISNSIESIQGNFIYGDDNRFEMLQLPTCSCSLNFQIYPDQLRLRTLTLLNVPGPQLLVNLDIYEYPFLESLTISMKRLSIENLEDDYIQNLFNKLVAEKNKLQLKRLKLDKFLIRPSNTEVLQQNINLNCLEELIIVNSFEVWFAPSRGIIRRSPPQETFFETISPYLTDLKSLTIGIDNELHCNRILISSIEKLACLSLKYLFINFKFGYRSLIVSGGENPEYVHPVLTNFAKSLIKFSNTLKELKVDINLSDSSSNGILPNCISSNNLPKEFFVKIAELANLEILTIPIHETAMANIPTRYLCGLKQLKYLKFLVKTSTKTVQRSCLINSGYFKYPNAAICNGCSYGDSMLSPNLQYINHCKKIHKRVPSLKFVLISGLLFHCGEKEIELWENISSKTLRSWLELMY